MKLIKKYPIYLFIMFLFSFFVLQIVTLAQVQSYSVEVELTKEGKSIVKKIITFEKPEKSFVLNLNARVENFTASSNAGLVKCDIKAEAISIISCSLPLTEEKRTLELSYETYDFVKSLDKKILFSGDFSIFMNVSLAYFAIKLPEGSVISEENLTKSVFPENYQTLSDGRRIIIQWNFNNLSQYQALKFQVFYEEVVPNFSGLSITQILLVSLFAIVGTALFFYRRIRRSKEVILSVLDENERKVIEIISSAGGEINQKRVVQETNLSKAKVSRIVKSLLDRGLIEVHRMGRTNKLKLVKKKI